MASHVLGVKVTRRNVSIRAAPMRSPWISPSALNRLASFIQPVAMTSMFLSCATQIGCTLVYGQHRFTHLAPMWRGLYACDS